MKLDDLLYFAELKLKSCNGVNIYLNSKDFKNIANECVLLNCYDCEHYKISINNKIKIFSVIPKCFLKNNWAIFDYFGGTVLEEDVHILTETERIIKNIIE
jgi:hypothetical protein